MVFILYRAQLVIYSCKIVMNPKQSDISKISQSKVAISDHELQKMESEIKKVQYPTYAISNAEDLVKKIDNFRNDKVKKKLTEKLQGLNSYRKVRGDGNCFFRALAFSYISSIREPSFQNCFKYIADMSLTCCFPQSIPKDFEKFYDHYFLTGLLRDNWDQAYRLCYRNSGEIGLKALLKLFTEFPYLDFIVILYFRSLCLKALWKFSKDFKEFLDGTEETAIRTYSQETEGVAIELCSKMLDIKIFVFEVRKEEVHMYSHINVTKEITSINLLFYENHYDIVEYNEHISAQNSVIMMKDDYYTPVNEKMTEGTCLECGTNGPVYIDSGLCFKCHEASLNTLHNMSKLDKFVKGKCGQCFRVKDEISEALGLCRSCIEAQSQMQSRRKAAKESQTKFDRCLMCKYKDDVYIETGICKICTRESKKLTNTYFRHREDEERARNQPPPEQKPISPERKSKIMENKRSELIYGKCDGCGFKTTISGQTSLCRECENSQRRLLERISPNKDRREPGSISVNMGQFKQIGMCEVCKFKEKIDPETRRCSTCYGKKVPPKSLIQDRYKCSQCLKDFSNYSSLYNEKDQICSTCLNKQKEKRSYDDCKCKKCGKMTVSIKFDNPNNILCSGCQKSRLL